MKHYQKVIKETRCEVPVISMSGNTAQDQEKKYTGFKIHAFLEKPISKGTLLGVVKSIK